MGNGESVRGHGICRQVSMDLQALQVVEDYLPIDLTSMNVILGMKCLRTLGCMEVE